MTRSWLVVVLVGAATIAIKGAAPLLLGGRHLPERVTPVLRLLAPALFAALVVTQVFVAGRTLTIDARLAGFVAAIAAVALRARPSIVLIAACLATAVTRLVFA